MTKDNQVYNQITDQISYLNDNENVFLDKFGLSYPESFFQIVPSQSDTGGSVLYYCQLDGCKEKKKTLSACKNSRGNLRKHVKVLISTLEK